MPNAGHILAKARETKPNHHFSSLIVHNIFLVPSKPHRLCMCLLNSICFRRLTSVKPGRIRLVYIQKSCCDFNQLYIVWEQHHSPVDLATLAYEREQFPPFSFYKAWVTASCMILCFGKWSLASFSNGCRSSADTYNRFSW
jgi:hypothetical protein